MHGPDAPACSIDRTIEYIFRDARRQAKISQIAKSNESMLTPRSELDRGRGDIAIVVHRDRVGAGRELLDACLIRLARPEGRQLESMAGFDHLRPRARTFRADSYTTVDPCCTVTVCATWLYLTATLLVLTSFRMTEMGTLCPTL